MARTPDGQLQTFALGVELPGLNRELVERFARGEQILEPPRLRPQGTMASKDVRGSHRGRRSNQLRSFAMAAVRGHDDVLR